VLPGSDKAVTTGEEGDGRDDRRASQALRDSELVLARAIAGWDRFAAVARAVQTRRGAAARGSHG
jgi:hypothetical protein